MAFRTDITAHVAFSQALTVAQQLKTRTAIVRTAAAAGQLTGAQLLGYFTNLVAQIASLNTLAAVAGVAGYAQTQYDDELYDVAAEFTTMVTAAQGVRDWIVTNFPASGGFIQREQISASGVTDRTFTAPQAATLVTVLDALTATIA